MIIHVVAKGETLELLARTYSVSVQRIISDNGLIYPYQLVIGQALIITQPGRIHTVKAGETAYSIAIAYGITVQQLYQNNPELSYGDPLYPGQILTIDFWGEKSPRPISVKGYAYPFIEPNILRRALPFLTYLAIFSYGFRTDGSLIPPSDNALLTSARHYQALPILVLTSLDESGHFSSALVHEMLRSPTMQDILLGNLINVMLENGYRGLDSDFEYIEGEDAPYYLEFLAKARDLLHANGLTLNVALAPKHRRDQPGLLYEGHDYAQIGSIADTVLLMTYEWGYAYGPPMAVAPINQVNTVLQYATSEIPSQKIFMGIPNYGYDWALPFIPGQSQATSIGNQEAIQLAASRNAVIQYDEQAQSPYFSYWQNGTEHVVWFEDVRSIQAKYNLMDQYQLLGTGYWNIMRPFPQNWAFLSTQYNIRKLI